MIYFDNAATSYPKPSCVLSAVYKCLEECGNAGRGSHPLAAAAAELIYDTRCAVAEMLGLPLPEHIIFTPNATFALNLAIQTRAQDGSHLLISDQEHNASLRPVYRLADGGRISYSVFSAKAASLEKELSAHLRPETDMLICNLTSNVTGNTIDPESLVEFSEKHGLYLIIDASQWLGHVPIPGGLSRVDAFCAPGHKGLYGLQGCGFLYLRDASGLPPFLSGGSGSESRRAAMPLGLPERYEAGTLPTPAIASLAAGINFVKSIGLEEIEARESALVRRSAEILSSFSGIRIWSRADHGGSLMSFSHEHLDPERIARRLGEREICARAGYHCAPLAHDSAGTDPRGTVRLSFGVFNTERELEILYRALKEIFAE